MKHGTAIPMNYDQIINHLTLNFIEEGQKIWID